MTPEQLVARMDGYLRPSIDDLRDWLRSLVMAGWLTEWPPGEFAPTDNGRKWFRGLGHPPDFPSEKGVA